MGDLEKSPESSALVAGFRARNAGNYGDVAKHVIPMNRYQVAVKSKDKPGVEGTITEGIAVLISRIEGSPLDCQL